MKNLPALISELCSLRFNDETSSEVVGGNRIRLLDLLANLFPDAVVQIWMAERRRKKLNLLLAYVHPRAKVPDNVNLFAKSYEAIDAPTSEAFLRLNREAMEHKVHDIFDAIGFAPRVVHHCTIDKILSVTAQEEFVPQNAPNILGWASIGFPQSRKLAEVDRSSILLIRTQLAMLLEQSRFRRILELTKQCELLLRSLPHNDIVERMIQLLSSSCGARSWRRYGVLGEHLTKILPGGPSPGKDEDQTFENWLSEEFKIIPYCRRYLLQKPQFGAGDMPPPKSILAIPIALSGRRLAAHDFRPLSTELDDGDWLNVVVMYIFLCDKRSPNYLGGSFSDTDLKMAMSVSHQLEDFLHARAFENQYVYISEFFESVPANNDLSWKDCREHLISGLPIVSDIQIIESSRIDDKETWIVNGSESTISVPSIVVDSLQKHRTSLTDDPEADQREVISICAVPTSDKSMYLLFHLPTKYVIQRYAILTLKANLVAQVSLDIINHFVKELHMYFRTQDAVKERGSMLAQIRHAVVAPLSAAALNLDVFHTEFDRSIRTGIGWKELQNDEEFLDLIPSAISLANQSLLIAQTGRYLLAPMTNRDLKIQHYNIVELLNKIKKAYVWILADRRITFRLTVSGRYSGVMTGDETMLWVIISNLLDNAIKFAHMRTEIAVTIALRRNGYQFQVQNFGVYLAANERAKIFRPYSRGSQEGNLVRRPGTGIGVPVSDMLLRAHSESAKLEFTSERMETQGHARTTFFFEMPYQIGSTR